ncbi:MAG: sodium:calcium antiporter [Geminicoccaceae bacterium]
MPLDPSAWSIGPLLLAFALLALLVAVGGTLLTRRADDIAQVTGLSAALVGALLLGATTSLPGTVVSISTAFRGDAELAIGNALGGIVAQTAFLAVADLTYRRGNLEHAAASVATLMQAALLIALLSMPLAAMAQPAITVWSVHPLSPLLFAVYFVGLRMTSSAERQPRWRPDPHMPEQREDDGAPLPDRAPWLSFAGLAVIAGLSGYGLGEVGVSLSQRTGVSQTAIGAAMTAVVTSLPELVTAVAAVRRGALQLAVGGIIGGNAYDVLFLAFGDVAYRQGSLYHAFNGEHVLLIALSILMTSVLVLGMLKRDRFGPANIGFESVLVLLLYVALLTRLFVANGM